MTRVTVPLYGPFRAVDSVYGHDPAAWQTALEIMATGLARCRGGVPTSPPEKGEQGGRQASELGRPDAAARSL